MNESLESEVVVSTRTSTKLSVIPREVRKNNALENPRHGAQEWYSNVHEKSHLW